MERVDEERPFAGEPVDVGGLEVRMPAGAELVEAEIVDDHHHEVRALARCSARRCGSVHLSAGGEAKGEEYARGAEHVSSEGVSWRSRVGTGSWQ